MQDLAGPPRRGLSSRLVAVAHQHGDLSTEVLFIELEGVFAVAAVVEIGVKLHDPSCPIVEWTALFRQSERGSHAASDNGWLTQHRSRSASRCRPQAGA